VDVAQYLQRNLDGGVFYYEDYQRASKSFVKTIDEELQRCDVMVVFARKELSKWQKKEVDIAVAIAQEESATRHFVLCLLEGEDLPADCSALRTYPRIHVKESTPQEARETAIEIVGYLEIPFYNDGLPLNSHIFYYEKDIISHFAECQQYEYEGKPIPDKLRKRQLDGCPVKWPRVVLWADGKQPGGSYDREVIAAALTRHAETQYHPPIGDDVNLCMVKRGLCFPEAVQREREKLYFPRNQMGLRVAIVVSGGIAPGINAVIDGIVQRHELQANQKKHPLEIMGLRNGFLAFDDFAHAKWQLDGIETSKHATDGGSFLGTSRDDKLLNHTNRRERLESIVAQLHFDLIDILYVIGGDGSMKATHALWTVAEELRRGHGGKQISVVAVPKTMDNDILWVWQAFGFMSAIEKAREVIEHLGTEVESNPRLCIVQLFGSASGFVVSHAVLGSKGRLCDVALIPENEFSMTMLANHIRDKIRSRQETIPRGLVVMAETAIPTDAMDYVNETGPDVKVGLDEKEKKQIDWYFKRGKRVTGQTDDSLRSAGLKIVSKGLLNLLSKTNREGGDPDWSKLRVFTNEPRHLLRAIPPSCTDIIFGSRLGTLAVDNAMAGYTDFMISQWLTEYVLVPLNLVVLGRKGIPKTGMFWRSVITKTGQPFNLVSAQN
jgi:6-phosphofructokinase 1